MSELKIGIGRVDYTPPAGLPLMGNFRDDYASRGVHDPLFSRAVVISNSDGAKVALVSVDVCMLDRDQVALMRKFIAEQSDLKPEHILIAATHTHSGPATISIYTLPKAEDDQIEAFLKKAAQSVLLANENLKEAKLLVGYGNEDRVSFNRRLKCKDGQTHMNWEALEPGFVVNALGTIDPQVIAMSVKQDDKLKAAVVNFPLHPAVLDYANSLYSADYPGYLAEAMSKILADDFVTIFFNGCCGNINHIDYGDPTAPRRGYNMTQRIGYMLAAAAKRAMNRAAPVLGDRIAISRELVKLKRLKINEETYRRAQEAWKKIEENLPGLEDGLPIEYSAPILMDMHEKQNRDDKVEVMAIRIGDVGIVGLPGEMFCELGLEIKKRSPAKHTMVIELANDAIGYMPTPEAFEQGGYEATPGSTKYEKDSGEKLAASALDQLEKLFGE